MDITSNAWRAESGRSRVIRVVIMLIVKVKNAKKRNPLPSLSSKRIFSLISGKDDRMPVLPG